MSTAAIQEVPTVPAQQAPAKAVKPVVPRQQFEVKPTWGLAWGLWWRMLLLSILIFGTLYLIVVMVMVLGFHQSFQLLPQG
jgi:predicted lipid-binding transport protein (Tim44 family)